MKTCAYVALFIFHFFCFLPLQSGQSITARMDLHNPILFLGLDLDRNNKVYDQGRISPKKKASAGEREGERQARENSEYEPCRD